MLGGLRRTTAAQDFLRIGRRVYPSRSVIDCSVVIRSLACPGSRTPRWFYSAFVMTPDIPSSRGSGFAAGTRTWSCSASRQLVCGSAVLGFAEASVRSIIDALHFLRASILTCNRSPPQLAVCIAYSLYERHVIQRLDDASSVDEDDRGKHSVQLCAAGPSHYARVCRMAYTQCCSLDNTDIILRVL